MFHAGCTPGVFPSRAFPSLESRTPLGACSPPVVTSWSVSGQPRLPAACLPPTTPPPSGVLSSSESVHAVSSVSLNTAVDALLGFLPPRVSHGTGQTGLRQSSSHVLWPGSGKPRGFPSPCARHLRVSLPAPCGLSPERLPSFLGFPPLSSFLTL
jgi:hypothetical protein